MTAPRGAIALGEQHGTCRDEPSVAKDTITTPQRNCWVPEKDAKEMARGKELISVSLERNESAPGSVYFSLTTR